MKLVRWGVVGQEKPGLIDTQGAIRDLSAHIDDINSNTLSSDDILARLAILDPASLPMIDSNTRLGACVKDSRQFIAVGLNYTDHAKETGQPFPSEPILFTKMVSCIGGPNDPIYIPQGSTKLDWEVELCIVIGRSGYNISAAEAASHIAGYCVCNDVSERAFQTERGGQWVKGKSAPSFGPIGPWMVTADEVGDPQMLSMWLEVDGVRHQDGSTANMIFACHYLVHYVSQFIALSPGDLITTGTPAGVALGMKQPLWLQSGQTVALGIDGLGVQCQTVLAS